MKCHFFFFTCSPLKSNYRIKSTNLMLPQVVARPAAHAQPLNDGGNRNGDAQQQVKNNKQMPSAANQQNPHGLTIIPTSSLNSFFRLVEVYISLKKVNVHVKDCVEILHFIEQQPSADIDEVVLEPFMKAIVGVNGEPKVNLYIFYYFPVLEPRHYRTNHIINGDY
jgi:hypothetical protein